MGLLSNLCVSLSISSLMSWFRDDLKALDWKCWSSYGQTEFQLVDSIPPEGGVEWKVSFLSYWGNIWPRNGAKSRKRKCLFVLLNQPRKTHFQECSLQHCLQEWSNRGRLSVPFKATPPPISQVGALCSQQGLLSSWFCLMKGPFLVI